MTPGIQNERTKMYNIDQIKDQFRKNFNNLPFKETNPKINYT